MTTTAGCMRAAEPILVLGHRGRLGKAVTVATGGRCRTVSGGREVFDLARPETVRRAVADAGCPVVINCAAYTLVDQAEEEPDLAMAVNGQGAGSVAQACAQCGAYLVHLSTDYVFDGKAGRPYREDDVPAPLSVYGRSKLLGENLVREALPEALIIRSGWLFGPGRPGFVETVVEAARRGRELRVVNDEVGSPTSSVDLAGAILELAGKRVGGVVHVVNSGRASRLELARRALAISGLDPEVIKPITSKDLVRSARRPAFSALDTRRFARLSGGPLPSWLDALGRYMGRGKEETA